MAKFRSMLSMWGYKKNSKKGNGWLVIEDTGDILVKNLYGSDPLGNLTDLVDRHLDRKQLTLRNRFKDEIILHMRSKSEAETFYRIISPEPAQPAESRGALAPDWQDRAVTCPQCHQTNASGAKFCNACGARLDVGCPACGHVNAPDSRYCIQCGRRLASAEPPPRMDTG